MIKNKLLSVLPVAVVAAISVILLISFASVADPVVCVGNGAFACPGPAS